MKSIPLSKLHADPRNANVCDATILAKLSTHIERSGFCPALVVRPYPKKKGHYIVVDGHHRLMVIKDLGWKSAPCQVEAMTEEDAGLLLLTLNRLRGTDIPKKRAELIESLVPVFSLDQLAELLPETKDDIEGLLALLAQDDNALEKALQEQMADEAASLPVPFGFMVPAQDADAVRKALAGFESKGTDHAQALVTMCQNALTSTKA